MNDWHPDGDLLLDLALSDVDQQKRDALTGHLALCDPCRADHAAIADSVDHFLAAAPRVAPPAGLAGQAGCSGQLRRLPDAPTRPSGP